MNANQIMKKLQKAILMQGLVIKINTNQFYSNDQNRFITMWILNTPITEKTKNGWKNKNLEILRTASAVEAVKCLADIYSQLRGK